MELRTNMYVRTEKGKIDKIIGFDGALILFLYDFVYGYIDENDIIKASNNIIDLIDEGDILRLENNQVVQIFPSDKEKIELAMNKEKNNFKITKKVIDKKVIVEANIKKEELAYYLKTTLGIDKLYIDMGDGKGVIINEDIRKYRV